MSELFKSKLKLVVITLARNEEKNISKCLNALLNQTYKPSKIIVVVDGLTTDNTYGITKHISRTNRYGKRIKIFIYNPKKITKKGDWSRVSMLFNYGLKKLKEQKCSWDFLAKVDADIILKKEYFNKILKVMSKERNIGIAGGITINESSLTVRGGNRIFRKKCWIQISNNGFMPVVDGEDTYLALKAKMFGWGVKLIKSARSIHLRSYKKIPLNLWIKRRYQSGYISYMFGYYSLFLIIRALYSSAKDKFPFITFFPQIAGYIKGAIKKKVYNKEVFEFTRRYQKRLLLGFLKGKMVEG